MAKCRIMRGVTGLRPPPGGAHAAQIVTSCEGEGRGGEGGNVSWVYFVCVGTVYSVHVHVCVFHL